MILVRRLCAGCLETVDRSKGSSLVIDEVVLKKNGAIEPGVHWLCDDCKSTYLKPVHILYPSKSVDEKVFR